MALVPHLGTIIDAADGFDRDGLNITADCPVHGEHPVSDEECSCRGTRYSAIEFAQWLASEVRIAGQHDRAGMQNQHLQQGQRARQDRRVEALAS